MTVFTVVLRRFAPAYARFEYRCARLHNKHSRFRLYNAQPHPVSPTRGQIYAARGQKEFILTAVCPFYARSRPF